MIKRYFATKDNTITNAFQEDLKTRGTGSNMGASDILEVYNTKDKKETEEIVAIGNVFITRGQKRAKGDKAVYLVKLQKIILTGTPKATAWEEGNMIEGREMIFLLDKDRFVANNRVRMKIYPKDEENKKEKSSNFE